MYVGIVLLDLFSNPIQGISILKLPKETWKLVGKGKVIFSLFKILRKMKYK
jgi:hypothetical protein